MIDDYEVINIIRNEMSNEKSLEAVTALKRVIDKIEVMNGTILDDMCKQYEQPTTTVDIAELDRQLYEAFK